MADPQDNPDGFDGETPHFDDAELEAALEHFERELRESEPREDAQDAPSDGDAPSFEEELRGLLGDKAKAALICTRLASAELLAAFCQLSDISADCIGSEEGAAAILHNLDGDGPEAAVKDLTKVVSGLSALLVVNRADKLEATVYYGGQAGEQLPPPFVFPSLAPFVEDVMLGITTIGALEAEGMELIRSDAIDQERAYAIIARHTRGDGGSASIE